MKAINPWAVCAALTLAVPASFAQALEQQQPVSAPMEATQFGVPGDAKFIFCSGADCPERSRKTLTQPLVAPPQQRIPARPSVALPEPRPVEPQGTSAKKPLKTKKHGPAKKRAKPLAKTPPACNCK